MDPPAYSPVRHQVEHSYNLSNGNGSWATLKVFSSARKANQMPLFLEGDLINGNFSLNLDTEDHIMAIAISVKGQIVSASRFTTPLVFLDLRQILWSKDMGDPRHPTPHAAQFTGKVSGSYFWPFSFTLPSHVTLDVRGPDSAGPFRLPETFLERPSQNAIQYSLEAEITRTRFRVDSKLQTMFVYIPGTRPPSPSVLRQLAYQEDRVPPGPDSDPDGWELLPPLTIQGKVFNTRTVAIQCLFYLAKPLCYTRGSAIPCAVTLSSPDSQAIDLLATSRSINVRLRRSVRSTTTGTSPTKQAFISDFSCVMGFKDFIQDVGEAIWSPTEASSSSEPRVKKLYGEIRLPGNLKSSSLIGKFCIEYSVDVLPFHSPGFTPLNDKQETPLLSQTIEIATLFARYQRPRPPAPTHQRYDMQLIADNYSIPPPRTLI